MGGGVKVLLWVPKSCLHLWGEVYCEITTNLLEAIRSGNHRSIGTAARWYAGIPQIFLRDPGKGPKRNAEIIEVRFNQYLCEDYTNLLTEWRAAKAKDERQRKPPKPDNAERRVDK